MKRAILMTVLYFIILSMNCNNSQSGKIKNKDVITYRNTEDWSYLIETMTSVSFTCPPGLASDYRFGKDGVISDRGRVAGVWKFDHANKILSIEITHLYKYQNQKYRDYIIYKYNPTSYSIYLFNKNITSIENFEQHTLSQMAKYCGNDLDNCRTTCPDCPDDYIYYNMYFTRPKN